MPEHWFDSSQGYVLRCGETGITPAFEVVIPGSNPGVSELWLSYNGIYYFWLWSRQ